MQIASRLAAASLAASLLALAPGHAAADDRGDRFERDHGAPAWADDHDRFDHDRFDGGRYDGRRDEGWRHRDHRGWDRDRALSQQRIRAIRFELRRLDDDRAAFHARFGWRHHKKVARYDAWYFAQRASLERELERLTWYAWR